jgi:hypothetical protein
MGVKDNIEEIVVFVFLWQGLDDVTAGVFGVNHLMDFQFNS